MAMVKVRVTSEMVHPNVRVSGMRNTLQATRAASDGLRKLALRIDVSQKDEMQMMREWLLARGQQIPDPRAHHMMGATLMPGMLTPEEMARLAAATGTEFDRLFLEGMI